MAKGRGKNRKRKTGAIVRPTAMPEARQQAQAIGRRRPGLAIGASLFLLVVLAGSLYWFTKPAAPLQPRSTAELSFVGSETCRGCHATEAKLWQASQHRHAMDHATEQSVRGDFKDTTFEYAGTRSRFFKEGKKFFVETDGPDGKLDKFEIKYTFGVEPLQQYLIGFPDGRIQALSIAWDTRPKDQGGQRWFHLYPDAAITSSDPLHWTKLNQNWNFMCAECHSTGVHKNYDEARDRFATTFAEIGVGCEGCHGMGSRHVDWARYKAADRGPGNGLLATFDERTGVTWSAEAGPLTPKRSAPAPSLRKEVETCGRCHARRDELSEDWTPGRQLSETHRVSLLDRRYFHADGQIRDEEETYNYAPFKQSRMFAKGVTCSDCHEPHSAALRSPGDGVCAQCHAPAKYASAAHRHHADVLPSLTCASCHMPERRYMVVDRRHDHGFRIPRPDVSAQTGAPNACNDCHRDKTSAWAAQQIETWFGPERHGYQTYARAFRNAWNEAADAQALLAATAGSGDVPGIVRASALAELPTPDLELARHSLADPDPMVRIAALDVLEALSPDLLWSLAGGSLSDPVRGVRIRAADLLVAVPPAARPAADNDALAHAAAEFVAAQKLNADRPDARTALGNFYARQGNMAGAEAEYRAAIRLDPTFAPAAINLADLYRQLGRDDDGARILHEALATSNQDGSLHYALGLVLVRQKRSTDALDELRKAAELTPDEARYAYVYALALDSAGHADDALAVLKESLRKRPNDRQALSTAVTLSRQQRDFVAALDYAQRLVQLSPDNPELPKLVEQLRRQVSTPDHGQP